MSAQTQEPRIPRRRAPILITIAVVALLVIGFFVFVGLYADVLWYDQLGFLNVLTTEWVARIVLFLIGFLAMAVPVWASIQIAGGFAMGAVADTDRKALMAQIDGNLVSCFLCCRAAVNAMLAARQGGRIVNVAARPALEWRSGAGMSAYAIAKAGVAVLTTTLAEEVAKDGILVNAVAPSIMDTPANRAAMPKADHAAWPKVEEVAATILFLASADNRVTRGAIVPVYGRS